MRDPDADLATNPAPVEVPTLNEAKAKHWEKQLHKAFFVRQGRLDRLQLEWDAAHTQLTSLAKDVGKAKESLESPDTGKGWTGPAAQAAFTTMDNVKKGLNDRAKEVSEVQQSLKDMYDNVTLAQNAFISDLGAVQRGAKNMHMDQDERDAIDDAYWESRNKAAKRILDTLEERTQTALAKMPIDAQSSSETPYTDRGPATTTRTSGTATHTGDPGSATNNSDGHPTGLIGTGTVGEPPHHTGLIPVGPGENPTTVVPTEGPGFTPGNYDPISSDGDVTGTTGYPTGTGPGGSQGSYPTGGQGGGTGGIGGGGVAAGGLGGAAGLGGMLRSRGAGGGMFGSGGTPRGGASSARGGAPGSRGQAFRTGGAGRGGTGMVPGGGGQARGGAASGRGSAVKGATGSGKYGVPKVGGKGAGVVPGSGQGAKAGGRGAAGKGAAASGKGRGGAAMGAAGRGGARKGQEKGQNEDVDKLTVEDEETWYDGTEESSPQVWQ